MNINLHFKLLIIALIGLLFQSPLFAQQKNVAYFVNIEKKVKEVVAEKMNNWLEKGEYEKTEAYLDRIADKDHAIQAFTEEAIDFYMNKHIDALDLSDYTIDYYIADVESFQINWRQVGDFLLRVPVEEAEHFKSNQRFITFSNPHFVVRNNAWVLSYLDVELNGKHYIYDLSDQKNYQPSDNFMVNGQDLNIVLPDLSSYNLSSNNQENLDEQFDVNSPLSTGKMSNPDAVAIVIGNRDYHATKRVRYALNDARAMKRYLIEVLGFSRENVIIRENATKGDFEYLFGNQSSYKGRLYNMIKADVSDIFVFYSGHGAPGLNDKKGYLVPIECQPNSVELSGYSLDLFYQNLSRIPARSKTIVIDACFSGIDFYENISPIIIRTRHSILDDENAVVFTSSSGSQVSTWYNAQNQGLFTFMLLKAFYHPSIVDQDNNGELSYQEVFDYLADDQNGVPYYARRLHDIEQTPTINGKNTQGTLLKY